VIRHRSEIEKSVRMSNSFTELAQASKSAQVNSAGLAEALRAKLRDSSQDSSQDNVRFDRSTRALYSTDGSNYRQVPIGVRVSSRCEDVMATVALCANSERHFSAAAEAHRSPANVATSLSSSTFPDTWARILEIDPVRRTARVQPGVVARHLARRRRKNITSPSRPILPRTIAALSAHDRQQLLRRPFRNGRQNRRQHRGTRSPNLRRQSA